MSATAVAEAEGLSLYPSSDDEESAVLADLVAMFPALDHDVILTVLQSHHGSLEAAVDYLMTASSLSESDQNQLNSTGTMYPVYDMEGQYSEDIGGLPEVVPTFELDEGVEEEDSETDEESTSRDSSPTPDTRVSLEDDPLPTYEKACMGTDVLPMPRYIVDDQPVESIETHIPSANGGGGGGEHQQEECLATAVQPDDGAQKHRVRKGMWLETLFSIHVMCSKLLHDLW